MLQKLTFVAFVAIAAISIAQCRVVRNDSTFQDKYSPEYCEKLSERCDTGKCTYCCDQVKSRCNQISEEIEDESDEDEEMSIPDSTDDTMKDNEAEILEKIRKINNRMFAGGFGLSELSAPVTLEDGTNVTFYNQEELEEIVGIKRLHANIDEQDGTPLMDNDIILTVDQARAVWNRDPRLRGSRTKRTGLVSGYVSKWPKDEKIYYVFDRNAAADQETVRVTRSVTNQLARSSCLNFEHGLPPSCQSAQSCDQNYLVITGRGGCASNVGMRGGGPQPVHMGPGCADSGIGHRQITHALGVMPAGDDCGSAHVNGQYHRVSRSAQPSFCQTNQINSAYCGGICGVQQNFCWNGGFVNPSTCNTCVCPQNQCGAMCHVPCQQCCGRQDCGEEVDCPKCPDCPTPPEELCTLGPWSSWSYCGRTCGPSCEVFRTRTVSGGANCATLHRTRESKHETLPNCPVCNIGPWSSWSGCSFTCGGPCTEHRSRFVTGDCPAPAPITRETQPKHLQPCSVDCQVSSWSQFVGCARTCVEHGGSSCQSHRTRTITVHPQGGGRPCPSLRDTRDQFLPRCSVDCVVSAWSQFTGCSRTCDDGAGRCQKQRSRTIVVHPVGSGQPCPSLHDSKDEYLPQCSADCVVSSWSQFTGCAMTCADMGTRCQQHRSRTIISHPFGNGARCPTLHETKEAYLPECPVRRDCQLDDWSSWSHCPHTCGVGSCHVERHRRIFAEAEFGGTDCRHFETHETNQLPLPPCPQQPIDCQWGTWEQWSSCSVTCGRCDRRRYRRVMVNARFGGRPCHTMSGSSTSDYEEEVDSTHLGECPRRVDCVSEWSEWGHCDRTCGSCVRSRNLRIITHPQDGGIPCPAVHVDTKHHYQPDCVRPVDCVSEWSHWGPCDRSCGTCVRSRNLQIITHPQHGGAPCPAVHVDTQQHYQPDCVTHCRQGEWTNWSTCAQTCGHCVRRRSKPILVRPSYDGHQCEPEQTEDYPQGSCSQNCILSDWSEWGNCVRSCGPCRKERTKHIVQEAFGGGIECKDYCVREQNTFEEIYQPPC